MIPIRRMRLAERLDTAQLVNGYLSGFHGNTLPKDATPAFEHGWRNGMTDKGLLPITDAQRELAHDYVESKK